MFVNVKQSSWLAGELQVVGGTKKVEEYLAEDAETAELEDKKGATDLRRGVWRYAGSSYAID